MPSNKLVKYGAWENGKFIGVVIYGCGATPELGKPYGVQQSQVCELVRVALGPHQSPTSRIIAITLRMLRAQSPGLALVVSFADSSQGHHGGIYQATNWLCLGQSTTHVLVVHGMKCHPRSIGAKYGRGGQSIPWLRKNVDRNARSETTPPKHRYVYVFDDALRDKLRPHAVPYPKRATSIGADAPTFQVGEGGSQPTVALHRPASVDDKLPGKR